MKRDELNDMAALIAVAASRLGMSPSALSHAIKGLEGRLGVRLLARTTRSVAPTEAGEDLLRTLRPAFEDIEAGLAKLGRLRDRPSGTVRLTTFKHAALAVVWPALPAFRDAHPDVRVEVSIDDGLILAAALAGQGLAYAWEDGVAGHVRAGRLVRVLEAYSPSVPGFHLYHPSRRQTSPALAALIEAMRARTGAA